MLEPLETERLFIQPMTEEHFEDILEMDSMHEVVHFIHGEVQDEETQINQLLWHIEEAKKHPRIGLGVMFSKEDGRFIGRCNLNHIRNREAKHLGYRILPKHWHKGYATETAEALKNHALNAIGLTEVYGLTHPSNWASQRVLLKIGMQYLNRQEAYGTICKFFKAEAE